jgi:hypothetical protein
VALIFDLIYPNGERAEAVGYPGQTLRVNVVPRGPEACYGDIVEVEFGGPNDYEVKVRAIVGGPRRKTFHVRVTGDRDAWTDARDAEGWNTLDSPDDSQVVWVVPESDDADPANLIATGAELLYVPIADP